MSKTKHTPGPWTVEIDEWKENCGSISIPEIERTLHDSEWADQKDWERDLANARLIAAAPRLYAACVAVRKAISHGSIKDPKDPAYVNPLIVMADRSIAEKLVLEILAELED